MAVPSGLAALVTQAPEDDTGSPPSSIAPESASPPAAQAQSWCRCFSRGAREDGRAPDRPSKQNLAAVVPGDPPITKPVAKEEPQPSVSKEKEPAATAPAPTPAPQAQPAPTVAKVTAPTRSAPGNSGRAAKEHGELKAKGHTDEPPQLGPQTGDNIGRKTLVLDLDETLVHSSFRVVHNADITITVEIEGEYHQVYVRKRPGCDEFLIRVAQLYEVVIYTASMAKYANPLLDKLDTFNVCTYRLFREACTRHTTGYVKDLSRLGRDLKHVIIIDNSPTCYLLQPDNAIPIRTWRDDIHDRELLDLIPILYSLADVDDIPQVLLQIIWAAEEEDEAEQPQKDNHKEHKEHKEHKQRSK